MTIAIHIRGLSKMYRGVTRRAPPLQALKEVSLSIQQGEFYGLLGPNGAGKTTLIKSIVGLAHWNSGSIRVFDMDPRREYTRTRALIGYSPQEPNTDRYFTVRRVLEFQGGYFGMNRRTRKKQASKLLEQFKLEDKANTQYWRLSGGMQKRVMIARAMMTHPRILFLDEPTAGIDVEQRHELWSLLKGLNKDGTTIILTTHYIDEAETLCERVGIIHTGQIIEEGTPKDLIREHCDRYFTVRGSKQRELNGLQVEDVDVHPGSLEEVFLKLTGHSIHEDESRLQENASGKRL